MKQSAANYYKAYGMRGGRKWYFGLCKADGMSEAEAIAEVGSCLRPRHQKPARTDVADRGVARLAAGGSA
jgi:hypothetical protein